VIFKEDAMSKTVSSKRPNVLLFIVDQFQHDVTQPGSPCQMPNLDRFTAEGVAFNRAYSPSPHCCPARATLMTGSYPSRHGVFNNVVTDTAHRFGLKPGVRTFSQDLAEAGYRLSYSGKWHVSNEETPADRGWHEVSTFDKQVPLRGHREWAGLEADEGDHTGWAVTEPVESDISGPRAYGNMCRPGWGDVSTRSEPIDGPDACTRTHFYEHAIKPGIDELHRLTQDEDASTPWCLCISTDMVPSSPCPRELLELYDPTDIDLPPNFHDDMADKPTIYRRLREQIWGQLSIDEVRQAMISYYANCTLEDRYFGMILEALAATGAADDTLVMFIGDHGEYNFAHGLQNMGIPAFREAYHVPVVARWPKGIVGSNRTVDDIIWLADIAPTLIDVGEATSSDEKTGSSLAPFLFGESPGDWRDDWYSQTNGNEVYYTQRAVMTERWKYVYNAFDYDELYDLRDDPSELVNLIHPSRYPQPTPFAPQKEEPFQPLPRISPELEPVRREMMARIWEFALREKDTIFSAFAPVAVASYGPMLGVERARVRAEGTST
jgi:arylsulfatase A-like enzyme